ncbi:MAG: hypothetical protein ACRYFZ_20400 [Janthinobacterium lividum]
MLKIIGKLLAVLVAVLLVAGVAFAQLSPELGGTPTQGYTASGHYREGKFYNPQPTEVMTGGSMFGAVRRMLFDSARHKAPAGPLPMQHLDSLSITKKTPDLVRVTWFGHSASLVEIAGQNLLLDPMLRAVSKSVYVVAAMVKPVLGILGQNPVCCGAQGCR